MGNAWFRVDYVQYVEFFVSLNAVVYLFTVNNFIATANVSIFNVNDNLFNLILHIIIRCLKTFLILA